MATQSPRQMRVDQTVMMGRIAAQLHDMSDAWSEVDEHRRSQLFELGCGVMYVMWMMIYDEPGSLPLFGGD